MDFTPNCRYGHGDLIKAIVNKSDLFALIVTNSPRYSFSGNLYICPSCGYTEFFDNDPETTAAGDPFDQARLTGSGV